MTKEYKYNYKEGETPIERLRNKLSCVFTLLHILKPKKETIDTDALMEEVRDLLDDAETHINN